MKKLMFGWIFVTLVPCFVFAQTSEEHQGQGYVFFAPGASTPGGTGTVHLGGGGEALVYKGLGVGGEIGYVAPWQCIGRCGLGVFSANGSYNFSRRGKLVPFVTGGYTLFFRSGSANGFNFGGGVNYWVRKRVGLRLEFRDEVFPQLCCTTSHFLGFRIGLVLR